MHQNESALDPASLYHLNSAAVRSKSAEIETAHDDRPPRFRSYPGAKRVSLPKGHFRVRQSLGEAFARRRSVRRFARRALPLERLSQLLFLSHGVRGRKTFEGEEIFDRCSPSAGALYPVELYVATRAVTGLPDGIHHYDARFHRLEQVRAGCCHEQLADLTLGQDMVRDANLVVVMTAVFRRTMRKYGQRGYRYVWLDAGHVGENLYFAAGGLGLGAVTIGGFFDAELNRLLDLPPGETAIYLACIGRPRKGV